MQPLYDHICLTVGDIERSVQFYERYFGLKPVRRLNVLENANELA